jgi:cytochrome c6
MADLKTFQKTGSAATGRPVPDFAELAKITILRRGGVGGLTFFIAEQVKQAGMVMESSIGQLAAPSLEAPVSAEMKAMVWNEVNHLIQDSYVLAKQLLAMNHKAVDALSDALLRKPLSGKEFAQIMNDNGVGVLVQDFNVLGQVQLVAGDVSKSARSSAARVAAVGAALMLTASPAFAGDAEAGEKIFNANCAACHAGGQNTVVADHTLEKAAIEKYLTGGFKESAVVTQVTNGKNAMPAFGGRLSDDDIANVATYVIATSEAGWD